MTPETAVEAADVAKAPPASPAVAADRAASQRPSGDQALAALNGAMRSGARTPSAMTPAALLAVQRTAGNRAAARMLARCAGSCKCGGKCKTDEDLLDVAPAAAAQAAAAPISATEEIPPLRARRGRRLLQRDTVAMPTYTPKRPFWATKDASQAEDECEPFDDAAEAARQWHAWQGIFPDAAKDQCTDCPDDVYRVWDAYFSGTGKPEFHWSEKTDGLICPIKSLKGDPDHERYEQPIIDAVIAAVPKLMTRLREGPQLMPLHAAGVPNNMLHAAPDAGCMQNHKDWPACLWLSHNTRLGAQLFGKGHDNGSLVDSEYGYDKRDVDGAVSITANFDPADPRTITSLKMQFYLNWHLVDAVDFCPGNTVPGNWPLLSYKWRQHRALVALSRLEASGMTRDIKVEAEYQRVRNVTVPGPIKDPNWVDPDPIVTIPSQALFDFNSDRLRPEAEQALLSALGTQPLGADLAKHVYVRGHTDGKGSRSYNQGLSERRAEAVKRLLEANYPNLIGNIIAEGYGEDRPVAPNEIDGRDNPAGRALNRRVEIEFSRRLRP